MIISVSVGAESPALPSKGDILAEMKLANDYFINDRAHNPCNNCLTGNRASNIWTRAVYYEGALAYFDVSQDSAALDHAVNWGEFHSWNLRNGDNTTTNADNQCAGQCYIDLYRLDRQEQRVRNIKTSIDRMLNNSRNDYWTWIDAIQMSMPVFAKLGVLYDETDYFDKMYLLYDYTKTSLRLYNREDGLWWRDADFINAKSPSGKKVYWSRGNGWVLAALVRVLDELPSSDPHREEYETTFTEMTEALKELQRDDGFWNENLDDPDHFGGPEITGTGLFTYGMAWGINNGLLSAGDYLPVLNKAWEAIDTAIFSTGKLGYVQGTGSAPGHNGSRVENVTPSRDIVPDFDDYGLGCVLLAGSELAILTEGITALASSPSRNPGIVRPSVHKTVVGNHSAATLPHNGSSVQLFDLQGKLVNQGRFDHNGSGHMQKTGRSEQIYLLETIPER